MSRSQRVSPRSVQGAVAAPAAAQAVPSGPRSSGGAPCPLSTGGGAQSTLEAAGEAPGVEPPAWFCLSGSLTVPSELLAHSLKKTLFDLSFMEEKFP